MLRFGLISLLVLSPLTAFANGASGSIGLNARAPLVCTISVQGAGSILDANSVALGSVRELCNGANGYSVLVSYVPGTLVGATLHLGDDSVVLDGTGAAVISEVAGAGSRTRPLRLDAGQNGIDSTQINLSIQSRG